jgi:hypothetical protein
VERELGAKEYAAGAFLDIEGALIPPQMLQLNKP